MPTQPATLKTMQDPSPRTTPVEQSDQKCTKHTYTMHGWHKGGRPGLLLHVLGRNAEQVLGSGHWSQCAGGHLREVCKGGVHNLAKVIAHLLHGGVGVGHMHHSAENFNGWPHFLHVEGQFHGAIILQRWQQPSARHSGHRWEELLRQHHLISAP